MKRPEIGSDGKPVQQRLWCEDALLESHPLLCAMLADVRWDDGKPRETSTLLVTVDAGTLKAWLNDRALHRSVWVSSDTFQGLLDALERGLREDSLAWRPSPKGRGR